MFPKQVFEAYAEQLKHKNPIKTKLLTAMLSFSVSDIVCQLLEKAEVWDYVRTMRMASTKGLISNPFTQLYFHFVVPHVDIRRFMKRSYGAKILNSMFRSTADFFFKAPVINGAILFFPQALKHMDFNEGFVNLKLKFFTAMKAALTIWPGMYFMNYQFVPAHLRVPFLDLIAFFYGIFLSYLSNRKDGDDGVTIS